jgi:hypothetical protein
MTSSLKENYDINKEWENFMSSNYDEADSDDEYNMDDSINEILSANLTFDFDSQTPKASDIYISTKTKIAYLNIPIDLKTIFWSVPIIPYAKPCNGVIKKQIKFNSTCIEELNEIQEKLAKEVYYEEYVITSINNPSGRTKFKDIRKVSIGISKKDIMSYRSKKKSAFYNCFVLILRLKIEQNNITSYREYHVKVFNTGKLEIPGIQNEKVFELILNQVIQTLQPHIKEKLYFKENTSETVLINSNFNCGFFINREILYDILTYKYKIQSIYDPCSYPGIQCKFYYNPDVELQTGIQISKENKHLYNNVKEVSFMIFRTGSVLIVGKCDENVLISIYEFLKIVLNNEFKQICQRNNNNIIIENDESTNVKDIKKKKIRRKTITISLTCK